MCSKLEQLKELTQLRENGDISIEEYEVLKQEILSNQVENTPQKTVSNRDEQIREDKLGSYVLKRSIGTGGQGTVYQGRHQLEAKVEQGGDVAIKILEQMNEDDIHRFNRSASIGLFSNTRILSALIKSWKTTVWDCDGICGREIFI